MNKKLIMILLLLLPLSGWTKDTSLGKDVYEAACINCHAPDKAKDIGAPAAFDKTAWKKVFVKEEKKAQEKHQNLSVYLINQIKIGKGLMPHKGLCLESQSENVNCSDKALLDAINYMSQQTLD